MYGRAFDGVFTGIFVGGIIVALIVCGIGFGIYKLTQGDKNTHESKTIIVPTIKLHTDGKTIDTIYVYKFK